MGLSQGALAKAMGVQRKHVNGLCNDRRTVTAPTALILARVFGNNPEFWLNRAAAHRSVGGDELTLRTRAN
jgi:addiction module HigA family antidote